MVVAPGSERTGQWSPAHQSHWYRGGCGRDARRSGPWASPSPLAAAAGQPDCSGPPFLGVPRRGRHPVRSGFLGSPGLPGFLLGLPEHVDLSQAGKVRGLGDTAGYPAPPRPISQRVGAAQAWCCPAEAPPLGGPGAHLRVRQVLLKGQLASPGQRRADCSRTSAAPLRPACLAPPLTYLWAHGRYDNVSGSLDPGLAINLHRCGLEEGDAEVGALGNADARAQPALDLALVRGEPAGLSGPQGHAGPRPPACLRSPCA